MTKPKWLNGYSGETTDQLLALSGEYRIASLVLAFEQAIRQKAFREGDHVLSGPERVVLAVEGLEREVNNGGYSQFLINSSVEFAPEIEESLRKINCPITAEISKAPLKALRIPEISIKAIEQAMQEPDAERNKELADCDRRYFQGTEPIAERLLEFIREHRRAIRL